MRCWWLEVVDVRGVYVVLVWYVHDFVVPCHTCGYIHTIGVSALTAFTGVDDGCDAGVWRWWMSGLVICVH